MNDIELLSNDNKKFFWLAEVVTQGERDNILSRKTLGDALGGQLLAETLREQNKRDKLFIKK